MSKARSLANRANDIVSVLDFGARGDGVTDDTAAIQAAIDSGAKNIFLPKGTYVVTTILFNNISDILFRGDGQANTIVKASVTGAASEPTIKVTATSASKVTFEKLCILGNGLSGASGNGNAISFINTAGTGFAPQLVTMRDVYIEGFAGTGKDNTGASMPSAGIYAYLGTSANFDNVSVYSCAQGMVLSGYQKAYVYNFVTDFCTTRGLYLVNCENIDFFGGIFNRCGSGGATDGTIVPQGCANLNFYGVRLKDGNPAILNSRSTTFLNKDITFFGCDWNQLTGVNTMVDCGTGDSGLKLKGGRWKWDNTVTAGVGVNVGNGPGGYQMTGLLVEDIIASIGSGGTIANLVYINNSVGVVHAPRVKGLQYGDGSSSASATTVTNGVHLSGLIDSPVIEELNLHAATNNTITNAINIDAAPGNLINPVIIAPVYRTTGGTITNQLVNTTGATVTSIQGGVTTSGNIRASAVSAGVAGTTTIGGTTATTVGAAGAASALPANPLGYIIGHVGTTQVKIPYYNA